MRALWLTCLMLLPAACGDPLAGVERVSETAPVSQDRAAAALPSAEELAREESVLSGLFRNDAPAPQPQAGEAAETAAADATSEASAKPSARGGVLGWLRRSAAAQQTVGEAPTTNVPADDASIVNNVADADSPASDANLARPASQRRIFGATGTRSRNGPDALDVAVGTILPFGQVARVCDARSAQLGKLVDQGARKGRGYRLFDTVPDSAAPRTFYVTGFADNCPRQFTAALALFGSPEFHEQLRYGLPADAHPYSTTDKAYEQVKTKVCNVGRNKPCGSRISRLERTTVFVSAYENFGQNARWTDILIHDGQILAAAVKAP
jgi:hypothetical protein